MILYSKYQYNKAWLNALTDSLRQNAEADLKAAAKEKMLDSIKPLLKPVMIDGEKESAILTEVIIITGDNVKKFIEGVKLLPEEHKDNFVKLIKGTDE